MLLIFVVVLVMLLSCEGVPRRGPWLARRQPGRDLIQLLDDSALLELATAEVRAVAELAAFVPPVLVLLDIVRVGTVAGRVRASQLLRNGAHIARRQRMLVWASVIFRSLLLVVL